MKKIIYAILATLSGLVLLMSYKTSLGESVSTIADATTPSTTSTTPTTTGSAAQAPASTAPSAAATPAPTATTATTDSSGGSQLQDGTYAGSTVNTRYGPVAVSVTVTGGQIAAVDVTEYPSSNRKDLEINQRALPQLVSETLSAQSATIQMVSGATYTSEGYLRSLQSALDQAAS